MVILFDDQPKNYFGRIFPLILGLAILEQATAIISYRYFRISVRSIFAEEKNHLSPGYPKYVIQSGRGSVAKKT